MKPIVYSTYGKVFDFDLNKKCEVYIDLIPNSKKNNTNTRVFIAMEPDVISKISSDIIKKQEEFDFIFTFDENILNNCSNSVLFEFGTTWIDIKEYVEKVKKFTISMVCGHKEITKNHTLRKKIWHKQCNIKTPIDFYISMYGGVENINNNKLLGENKFPLFDSMFHICIENVSQKYYFSEKLIDCFVCKTVPIYIGCKNIENYFNTKGIIIANDFNELMNICNSLTEKDYFDKIEYIEENYKLSLNWIDYDLRFKDVLNKKLNTINDFNFISHL